MTEKLTGDGQDESFSSLENSADQNNVTTKILRFLDKLGADEVFCDPQHIREYIDNLEYDTFKELLMATNAAVRGISLTKRSADGENVYLTGGFVDSEYIPPKFEEKDGLLVNVFSAIKRMNATEASLEDIAILLSACINAIHLFNDGNGRTSRLSYSLIKNGYTGTQEDKQFVSEIIGEDGRQIIDVNPGKIKTDLNALIYQKLIGLNPRDPLAPTAFWGDGGMYRKETREILSAREDISDEDRDFLIDIICSDEGKPIQHGFLAVTEILSAKGKLSDYTKTFEEDNKPVRSRLLIGDALIEFTPEDVGEIRKKYWEIKSMFVDSLIGSIENPNEFETTNNEGNSVTILSELKESIKRSAD